MPKALLDKVRESGMMRVRAQNVVPRGPEMTKKEYTTIRIDKETHDLLREHADGKSIRGFIRDLLAKHGGTHVENRLQSIEVSLKSLIDTTFTRLNSEGEEVPISSRPMIFFSHRGEKLPEPSRHMTMMDNANIDRCEEENPFARECGYYERGDDFVWRFNIDKWIDKFGRDSINYDEKPRYVPEFIPDAKPEKTKKARGGGK